MRRTSQRCIYTSIAAAIVAVIISPMSARPFEPDPHTLLLAHFDDNVRRADFATGSSLFAGNGATLIEGYYGKAIDLRARGLMPDFTRTSADYSPRYDGWGFRARGNVDPAQGTFECFFRVGEPGAKRLLWSANFLGGELSRSVRSGSNYRGIGIILNAHAMRYFLPTVAGNFFEGEVNFRQTPGLGRPLDPNDWHHFAMTWSQGELVIWLDGRELVTFDMTDQHGLVMMDNPTRYLNMSDIVLDELRISRVVRYSQPFEPAWRDGRRPSYAFEGRPDIQRHDAKLFEPATPRSMALGAVTPQKIELGPWTLTLNRRDGSLAMVSLAGVDSPHEAGGLLLYRGLERERLTPTGADAPRRWQNRVLFRQTFSGDIVADHELHADDGAVLWRATLTNRGPREAWLEPQLSLPVPLGKVEEWFDGIEPRRQVGLARRHDEYAMTLPFTAAAGEGQFVGVGISPRIDVHEIVSEWVPPAGSHAGRGGVIRQGTRVALSPGESFTYEFHLVAGEGDFATLDAIDAYHRRFPDLYRLLPDVPVYTYMPMTQYEYTDMDFMDMKRVGMAGNLWGHGPGHDKGDEYGNPDWWDTPAVHGQHAYENYTRRIEALWGTIANVRELITLWHHRAYDNWYSVRRCHTCPDVTPDHIVQSLWPGYQPNEDPLCFGQYYQPTYGWWIVNELDTPIGAFFRETTRNFIRQTKGKSNGFINDMSHAGSLYRHNDPIAQRTPGRAWSRDLGPFVRKAAGRRQRYDVLNHFVDDGSRSSFWSDGGAFSYTLGAYSAGVAIEGAALYMGLTGFAGYVEPARFLLGEKPISAMTHHNDDWIGYYLQPDEFTPRTLRDYYRFCGRQLVLFALEHGMTLDPTSYMHGRQFEIETAPLMVESAVLGRKIVPAAQVAEPLWVRRSGEGLQTLLIVGNYQPRAIDTEVTVYHRYFDAAPLFVPYYGGQAVHAVEADTTRIRGVTVPARDLAAFKAAAVLATDQPATVTSRFEGDGLTLTLSFEIDAAGPALIEPSAFAPIYQHTVVTVNGQPQPWQPGQPIALSPGRSTVTVACRNSVLAFDTAQWDQVELIRDGATHFQIVADRGEIHRVKLPASDATFQLGYERGTAGMLIDFIHQYDVEDGVLGNLSRPAMVPERQADFSGWTIELREDAQLRGGEVSIDTASRTITVAGPTQGRLREAMVVFMRMVDRKYPHLDRLQPMRSRKQHYANDGKVPLDKWMLRRPSQDFYRDFTADPLFLAKPVLSEAYEELYADGNMDFAGRYQLRVTPHVVEPTFGDRFVYGYSGPGRAESQADLHRQAQPRQENR